MGQTIGLTLIENHLRKTAGKRFQENAWGERHVAAFQAPQRTEVIAAMIRLWILYADAHRQQYEGHQIGDDGVLGPHWRDIGHDLVGLLNGNIGRLDAGALDGLIRDALAANGCERDW